MRYRRLDANGDYVFGSGPQEFLVNTPAAVAQAVETVLKLWQGEWFLDSSVGVPYRTQILGFGTQRTRDAAVQSAILNTQGVNRISDYSSSFDPTSRKFSVNATIDTIYGTTQLSVTL